MTQGVEAPFYTLDGDYAGDRPRFHAPGECPAAAGVAERWKEIREEVEGLLRRRGGTLEPNFSPYGDSPPGWRSLNLETYRYRYHANRRELPRTVALLDSIPGLTSAFVNVLEPGSRVPSHCGDSNTTWRCHLGLIVPGDVDRCGIEVGGERRGWREGECFVMCDAHRHHAWNETERPRVVLIFDVMRPEYLAQRDRICGRVLVSIALQWLQTRLGREIPRPVVRALRGSLGFAVRLALPLQRIDWLGVGRRQARALAGT